MIDAIITVPLVHDRQMMIWWGIGGPGCYAVFDLFDKCLYVGKSKHTIERILSHWRYDNNGNRKWICKGGDYWGDPDVPHAIGGNNLRVWISDQYHELELKLIESLSPIHNTHRYAATRRIV